MKKQKLVRYVPPSGCGSPAWMTQTEADKYAAQDAKTLEALRRIQSE